MRVRHFGPLLLRDIMHLHPLIWRETLKIQVRKGIIEDQGRHRPSNIEQKLREIMVQRNIANMALRKKVAYIVEASKARQNWLCSEN